jgi:hypothetical protein
MEAEMAVAIVAEMSSTDLNKTSGKVLDAAVEGPVRKPLPICSRIMIVKR